MAVWKASIAVSAGCMMSYIIKNWKHTSKNRMMKLLPLLPAWLALISKLRPGYLVDRAFVSAGHCVYHALFALSLAKWVPFEYGILFIYAPLPLVFERKSFGLNEATHNDTIYALYIRLFWSFPIISSMKILSNVHQITSSLSWTKYVDRGIHSPLISIITDEICVGRLPLNHYDVNILRQEPYNVRAVVNMCIETEGPTHLYKQYKIKYAQYKTVDTMPPRLEDIIAAMQFIDAFIAAQEDTITENETGVKKRVLIHCRGGRSRSATVALCWLLKCQMTVQDAMSVLKGNRKAIHEKIAFYPVVYDYANYVLKNSVKPPRLRKRLLSFHWDS